MHQSGAPVSPAVRALSSGWNCKRALELMQPAQWVLVIPPEKLLKLPARGSELSGFEVRRQDERDSTQEPAQVAER